MSVEEAYKAIPHRQTPYDPQQSRSPAGHAAYLNALFTLTDEAMRLRVTLLGRLYHGKPVDMEAFKPVYELLLSRLGDLSPPDRAAPAHALIAEAIEEQREFFTRWAADPGLRNRYTHDPLVKSAHEKLLRAYNILLRAYPQETPHNKQAFFDHLCALDFL